jgi:hypothetical protein
VSAVAAKRASGREPRIRRSFTAEEVDRALLAVAVAGGNTERAAAELRGAGLEISGRLLRAWKSGRHADRYSELRKEHYGEIEARIVQEARENITRAAEVVREGLALELERIRAKNVKDASASARNAAVVAAVNNDKLVGPLMGRPSAIVAHRTLDQYLQDLARRYPGSVVVDGTVEEIPPAQLAEAED